jgi:hypothetical protein
MAKKLILLAMAIGAVAVFIYPTKALAVLARADVENPRSLGLVPATAGYIDATAWGEIVDVQSKPIVAVMSFSPAGGRVRRSFRG